MNYFWNKPVLTFYRDKNPPEKEPFVVVKTTKLEVTKSKDKLLAGEIIDFFPLMGTLDSLSTIEGIADKYIICWFDDTVDNLSLAFRRLVGVTFSSKISFIVDEKGKLTYNAKFKAKNGKVT